MNLSEAIRFLKKQGWTFRPATTPEKIATARSVKREYWWFRGKEARGVKDDFRKQIMQVWWPGGEYRGTLSPRRIITIAQNYSPLGSKFEARKKREKAKSRVDKDHVDC